MHRDQSRLDPKQSMKYCSKKIKDEISKIRIEPISWRQSDESIYDRRYSVIHYLHQLESAQVKMAIAYL